MFNFNTQGYPSYRIWLAVICFFMLVASSSATNREGLVLQVSDNNPKTWNLVLNIARNAPKNVSHPLDITVVAFGPGLKMLTMNSKVANRLEKATANGVEFRACGMTMKKLKLKDDDLYPNKRIKRVDGGVIEIMRLQKAGWSYIKP